MLIHNPIVLRIAMLLEELEEGPLRAAYMVVNQLHELQTRGAASMGAEEVRQDEGTPGERRDKRQPAKSQNRGSP